MEQQIKTSQNDGAGQIAGRMKQMPKIHRKIYEKAMQGKSLKSAVKSFCLECVCWQKEEIRLCTSLACPLHPYRPYKCRKASPGGEMSKQASEAVSFGVESTNAEQLV